MARLILLALFLTNLSCKSIDQKEVDTSMKKCTPILVVDAIEPCLPFWIDRLGFTKTMDVPDGDRLVFAGLARGPVEIMLQTLGSIVEDMPALAPHVESSRQFLFIEVEDLDAIRAGLLESDIFMPERETFYGTREIGAHEPGGHFLTFAERIEGSADS